LKYMLPSYEITVLTLFPLFFFLYTCPFGAYVTKLCILVNNSVAK